MRQVLVVGEALMDLIPVSGGAISEMVGGGPCNSAKALARLGFSTTFIGGISSDSYGEAIEKELLDSGVSLDFVHRSDLPTALAAARPEGRIRPPRGPVPNPLGLHPS